MWYLNIIGLILIVIAALRMPGDLDNITNGLLLIIGGALLAR